MFLLEHLNMSMVGVKEMIHYDWETGFKIQDTRTSMYYELLHGPIVNLLISSLNLCCSICTASELLFNSQRSEKG